MPLNGTVGVVIDEQQETTVFHTNIKAVREINRKWQTFGASKHGNFTVAQL